MCLVHMRITWLISISSLSSMHLGQDISGCALVSNGSTSSALPACSVPFYTASWGRPAWDPADLLRSLVVMVLAGETSISDWVELMRAEPLYAVLSGFAPDKVPGVGTFYDFMDRLVGPAPASCRRTPHRLTAPRKRELREAKRRPSRKHEAIVARIAEALQDEDGHWAPRAAERTVNQVLTNLCVRPAAPQGLLPKTVGVSGNGTKVATYANGYGRKDCECAERQCGCPRRFADPQASTGYDAFHNRFVHGHTLYSLTAWSLQSKMELPIYLMRATGRRSDAVLGPLALARAREVAPLQIQCACFDGAHDAAAFYDLGQHWGIPLLIPLAGAPPRNGKDKLARDPDGTPLCMAGRRMYPDGYQKAGRRNRWRCPLKKGPERGDVRSCEHRNACSTARSGRIVYTYPGKDARLNCVPARGSLGWTLLYNHRTASERAFSRQKVNLRLAQTRTRGGNRWLFRELLAAIAHHLIAWDQHQPTT